MSSNDISGALAIQTIAKISTVQTITSTDSISNTNAYIKETTTNTKRQSYTILK